MVTSTFSDVWKKYQVWIVALVIIFVFSMLSAAATWHTYSTTPWNMNSDQVQFGSIVYKALNPDWYATDFVFKDDYYTAFYTPTFLQSMVALTRLAGDYIQSLALTQFPLTFFYLITAFLLYQSVTKSYSIAMIFALLSVIGYGALNSEWEMVGLRYMLARSYAMPAVILTFYWLIRIIHLDENRKSSIKAWFIMGLLLGLTANFHPTTGMTLAMSVGSIGLVYTLKTGSPGWRCLIVLVIGTFIGGIFTIVYILGRTSVGNLDTFTELTSKDFRNFAALFEDRIRSYPFNTDFGRGWTHESEEVQFLIRLPYITLTLVSWFLAKVNQRSKAALFFYGVQLVYIWLVVDNLDVLALVLIVAYSLYKWARKDDQLVLLCYEISAIITAIAIFMPLLARPIWWEFEMWSFSTVIVELSRGARQLHIPLTLLLACLATDVWNRWRVMDAPSIWLRFMLIPGVIASGAIFVVTLVLNGVKEVADVLFEERDGARRYVTIAVLVISGIVVVLIADMLWRSANIIDRKAIVLSLLPYHYTVLAGVVMGLAVWLFVRHRWGHDQWSEFVALSIGLVAIGCVQTMFIKMQDHTLIYDPVLDLAQWAKEETDQDALFMFYWERTDLDEDRFASWFRLFSNRSLNFTRKELNVISYSHPEDLASQYERFEILLDAAYKLPADEFRAIVEQEGVDYIIIDRSTQPANFGDVGYDRVWHNSHYHVYKTDNGISNSAG